MCEKMVADLVARQCGGEAVKPSEDWASGKSEKVGNTLRGREESSLERRRRRRGRGKAQGRRRAAINLLVEHVQKKIVMAEKVRPRIGTKTGAS